MVREINIYGNPVLDQVCVPCELKEKKSFLSDVSEDVEQVWPDEIVELVQDLKDTANSNVENTLGLAAPQIWWKDTPCPAIFVVRANKGSEEIPEWVYTELLNPEIKTSGKTVRPLEGCLSVPKYMRPVKREANVTVTYQLVSGPEVYTSKLFGKNDFNAIVIQHEYDHLMGKLIKK